MTVKVGVFGLIFVFRIRVFKQDLMGSRILMLTF